MMRILLVLLSTLWPSLFSVHAETSSSLQRPPFLSHVNRQALQAAMAVAKERHAAAVAQALAHYPTDDCDVEVDPSVADQRLKEYTIEAPGALPDFVNELDRKVYVTDPPLLTAPECAQVIADAEAHFQGRWSMQKSGQYNVAGFWIKDVPAVEKWFVRTVKSKLFPLLAQTFPDFIASPEDLCVDNAYLFKYTPETGRRTDVHTDSGCLSFTIALNAAQTDYTGGGTWFEGLDQVVEMSVGQVTVRPGGVKHCGQAVTLGTRYIIGGFCLHRHKPEYVRQLLTPPSAMTPKELLQDAEAAVALNPACDAGYNLLAHAHQECGDEASAQQVLEYAVEHVHQCSGELSFALGSIYLRQGRIADARRCFATCLQADEGDVDALMSMAESYAREGDKAGEEQYYRRVIDTQSASDKIAAAAYTNLGVLYEGRDEEVEFYQKALALQPHVFATRYSLACAYTSRKEWQAAVDAFRAAMEYAEDDDRRLQAVQSLYRATSELIRNDTSAKPPTTREEMTERFQAVMGKENYNLLLASAQRR